MTAMIYETDGGAFEAYGGDSSHSAFPRACSVWLNNFDVSDRVSSSRVSVGFSFPLFPQSLLLFVVLSGTELCM